MATTQGFTEYKKVTLIRKRDLSEAYGWDELERGLLSIIIAKAENKSLPVHSFIEEQFWTSNAGLPEFTRALYNHLVKTEFIKEAIILTNASIASESVAFDKPTVIGGNQLIIPLTWANRTAYEVIDELIAEMNK